MAIATERRATVNVTVGGQEITFESGKLAKQADGAVVVRSGDTMVLATAQGRTEAREGADFFPLTVDVEERMYAAGKSPGGFFKREGRPTERAILTARMIDRPIRPLFPKGWRRETQLVSIPISVDHVNPYDILAMNGASAALMVSDIPFPAPVGAVRIGQDAEGNFLINPDEEWLLESPLDLVVAGSEEAILMVEAGASEIGEAEILDALDIAHGEIKKLCAGMNELREKAGKEKATVEAPQVPEQLYNEIPEAEVLDALDIAHDAIRKICAAQRELAEKAGKEKLTIEPPQIDEDLVGQIAESHGRQLDEATSVEDKLARQDATKAVEEAVLEQYSGDPEAETYAEYRQRAQLAFDRLEKTTIRERIAKQKRRPDGRGEREIRPITIEVGVAPRTHGSALFTRGQTQALSVAALGTLKE
ncbi:MAG TPA: hypothetical protein VF063_09710, partial [Gaiellaceae bacterium]